MNYKKIGLLLAAAMLVPWGASAQDNAAPAASAPGTGTVIFFRTEAHQ